MAFRIRVELMDIGTPPVWRELRVLDSYNFDHLHHLIRRAMLWNNKHLYRFYEKESSLLTIDSPANEEGKINAQKVFVSPVFMDILNTNRLSDQADKMFLYYLYDFGDSWKCRIDVLEYLYEEYAMPKLLNGNGAAPPVDLGGPRVFDLFRKSLRGDASTSEYEQVSHLLDDRRLKKFNPDRFDLERARYRV